MGEEWLFYHGWTLTDTEEEWRLGWGEAGSREQGVEEVSMELVATLAMADGPRLRVRVSALTDRWTGFPPDVSADALRAMADRLGNGSPSHGRTGAGGGLLRLAVHLPDRPECSGRLWRCGQAA